MAYTSKERKLDNLIFTEIFKGLTGKGNIKDLMKLLKRWKKLNNPTSYKGV